MGFGRDLRSPVIGLGKQGQAAKETQPMGLIRRGCFSRLLRPREGQRSSEGTSMANLLGVAHQTTKFHADLNQGETKAATGLQIELDGLTSVHSAASLGQGWAARRR